MLHSDSRKTERLAQPIGGFILSALAVGLLIGVLTIALQGLLPYPMSQIANSGAVWVIVAFVFGRFAASWFMASIAGVVALIGEVTGYYAAAYAINLLELSVSSMAVIAVWIFMAVVAGSLFGAAGYVAFHQSGMLQKLGRALLGAAFIGEGLYYLITHSFVSIALGWFGIAIVITFLLARKMPQALQIWLLAIGLGVLALGGFQALLLLEDFRAANF